MLFNSFEFATFFLVVYLVYLRLSHRHRTLLLLVASYVFYGSWDWRFLSLILFSTALDFWVGQRIHDSESAATRRRLLLLSLVGNLTVLGFFKYFNFFADSFRSLLMTFGASPEPLHLDILLPVGISFYTFQTLSYSIDIYRRRLEPTQRLVDFALFVAFFPQLVAGPIEKARHLLPQITTPRPATIANLYEGTYLIGWGVFLKVFAADNVVDLVDPVFAAKAPYAPATVWIGILAFSVQIFCDFAGYSSIARGTAKCLGFDLVVNFDAPYLATSPADFWQRWHMSLSSWFRDYVFMPLSFSKRLRSRIPIHILIYISLGITWALVGLWHGADWRFVVWGVYQGLLLALHRFSRPLLARIRPKGTLGRRSWWLLRWTATFHLVVFGLLLFRASISQSLEMTGSFFWGQWTFTEANSEALHILCFYAAIPMLMHIGQYRSGSPIWMLKAALPVRVIFYLACFYGVLIFGVSGREDFIYFQF